MKLHIGCCGFALPQKTYYQRFHVIEVQQTFYQPPKAATATRWRSEAPPDFQFVVKAWQLITHEPSSPTYRRLSKPIPAPLHARYGSFRATEEVRAAWEVTRSICEELAAPVVLFQTPASFTPTQAHRAQLENFFRELPRAGRRLIWEPRGLWEPREVAALCGALELVHGVDPLQQATTSTGLAYYRLHGLGAPAGSHSDAQLEKALAACAGFDEVFVLFNNVHMARDAERFRALAQKLGEPER